MNKNTPTMSNQNGFAPVILLLVAIAVLVVGAGVLVANKSKSDKTLSGSMTETKKEKSTNSDSKVSNDDAALKLPKDFPKNLPQYPDAKITEALTSVIGSRLIMNSSDSQEKIMAYYLKELPKLGWTMGSRDGDFIASEFLDSFYSDDLNGTIGTDTDGNGTASISLSTITK